jgi:hypothetical protein
MSPPRIYIVSSRRLLGDITPQVTQTIEPSGIVNSKMPMYRTYTVFVFPITARSFSSIGAGTIIFPLPDHIRGPRWCLLCYDNEVSVLRHF